MLKFSQISLSHLTRMVGRPDVTCVFHDATKTAQYIVACPDTRDALIIDAALDFTLSSGKVETTNADEIVRVVKEKGYNIKWLLETHVHADHLTASAYLKTVFPEAKIGIRNAITVVQATFAKLLEWPEEFKSDGSQFDVLFEDGQVIPFGKEMELRVMATPGHTPACSTYVVGDCAFCGDTIFMPDFGSARCDFPNGSADVLYDSVQSILALRDDTRLFVGHDYAPGGRPIAWETTIAEERMTNIHLRKGISKVEFAAMRKKKDLTLNVPALLYPALQVNCRAGVLPAATDALGAYFRIPASGGW